MYYNISIVKTEQKLLKELDIDPEVAFINGLCFVDNSYILCTVSDKQLPQKCTDYIIEKYVKNCGSMQEHCICGKWCYMYYNKKRKEKKNGK